jgi:type II secretory pathway pseudopilin PulG
MLRNSPGHTFAELLVALALISIAAAMTMPRITAAMEGAKTRTAAFYVSSRFALARTLAAQRNANVAFRFEREDNEFRVRAVADGNGNGVLSEDIRNGVDVAILPDERLDHLFSGVRYGFVPGARLIDGTAVSQDDDPIRFGRSDMLTFTPSGTATPGTVYIRSRRHNWQFAVVVLGATGRTRLVRFDGRTRQWIAR